MPYRKNTYDVSYDIQIDGDGLKPRVQFDHFNGYHTFVVNYFIV